MTLPNFLIIGTAKSGTSSLYSYLKQHPQIFMSALKEPRFFGWRYEAQEFKGPGDNQSPVVKTITEYERLFSGAEGKAAIGEASPSYLYNPLSAEEIRRTIPHAKLIAILRHPAERAYSHYLELIRDDRETVSSFERALASEKQRIDAGWHWAWHYTKMGLYYQQLKRYYDRFPREQIRVFLQEELDNEPQRVLQEIYRFLGVRSDVTADLSVRHNRSGIPRNRSLNELLEGRSLAKEGLKLIIPQRIRTQIKERLLGWNLQRPQLSSELHAKLTEFFRPELEALEQLIEVDLSAWLGGSSPVRSAHPQNVPLFEENGAQHGSR